MSPNLQVAARRFDRAPETVPLTKRQSVRLAELTGIAAEEFAGLAIAEIADKFRWRIEPELLLFRRICGRVVKRNPITGVDHPVPFATVHVEDTDCSFFGLFPVESPWSWFFPIFCRREELATVTTDACGRFCVWIPRFDIDWILRWRLKRFCRPEFFYKPNLRELLEVAEVLPREKPPIIRPPQPGPDPAPDLLKEIRRLQPAAALLGQARATRIAALVSRANFGEANSALGELLDEPAFAQPLAPPTHEKLLDLQERFQKEKGRKLAAALNMPTDRLERLDLNRYVGPFLRWHCETVIYPEIAPIIDVPDITFRVTQDVDGDGDEETIYSEGFFDVRWNAGAIPNVLLFANDNAVAALTCGQPEPIGCESLGIKVVGDYQLANPPGVDPYHDPATGYARRPNRPHADGVMRPSVFAGPTADPLATAPFGSMLLLRGCNQAQGAHFYRVKYSKDGGAFTAFTGLIWPNFPPLGGPVTWFTPDASGWYPIDPNPTNWMIPNLLLAWPSGSFGNGVYDLLVELGDGAKNHLVDSPVIRLTVDNVGPTVPFKSIKWRVAEDNLDVNDPSWQTLSLACPVVRRPAGAAIEFCVTWQVTAPHLRQGWLSTSGCGSPLAVLNRRTAVSTVEHWHTGQFDNGVQRTAIFRLNYHATNQGAYNFYINGYSRTIDPGHDTGFVADWQYDHVIYGGTLDRIQVAVVDA